MRRLGFAAAVAIASMLSFILPSSASAVSSTVPVQERGVVIKVLDGDTFLFRDSSNDVVSRIRLLGVNTPEVPGRNSSHFSQFFCGAKEAETLLESLLPPGTFVELRSTNVSSVGTNNRPQRYAYAYNPATQLYDIDVQEALARAGLAMWFTVKHEAAHSYAYRLLIEQAQQSQSGMWGPTFCQATEQLDASIEMYVNWDAQGNDITNVNGEYVVVRNTGSAPIDLSGWLLRDSSLEGWYYFPAGTILDPNDYRTVHVGVGAPAGKDLYMGLPKPIFANAGSGSYYGDGAYLIDRSTAVRFYYEYPCATSCEQDGLWEKIYLTGVNTLVPAGEPENIRANQEYLVVENRSDELISLDGYYLKSTAASYTFPPNTLLPPGSKLVIYMGVGTASAGKQYWGSTAPLLGDLHDSVSLLSLRNTPVSTISW